MNKLAAGVLMAAVGAFALFKGEPAFAQTKYVLSEADCRLLTRHDPAPDVAYQPGVDVHGRTVVPADLGGAPPIKAPETFTIDIDVFLADRLGIPADRKQFVPEANVAVVTVDGDRVYFDGQPLSDLNQQAIAEACQKKFDDSPGEAPSK
ncbi:MAG: hypothetical protein HQ511_14025 [Rhodospirillales bacterium]|nr:hypothetical protein [Rhodospirillales bacterium]